MSFLRSFHIIVSVSVLTLLLYEVSGVKAFHPINVRKLYDFGFGERFKKDSIHPPTLSNDEDVAELEKLKNPENSELPPLLNNDDILPALEKQLESVTISSVPTMMVATTTTLSGSIPEAVAISNNNNNNNNSSSIINQGQPEKEEHVVVQHKPPTLTNMHNTPVATNHEQQKVQQQQQSDEVSKYSSSIEKSHPLKPFYGAARLAFGQNPEVIPLSSSSTATTITTTATTAASQSSTDNSLLNSNDDEHMNAESSNNDQDQNNNNNNQNNDNDNDKNSEGSVSAELEATKNGERRSVNTIISPKIAESLLNHRDGHYSSFDMAQYVFWTGDEAGVAKAVEELIQQGLMSRENAIKFLRDIRLGIEYLQNSYANRIYPDYIKGNNYVFPPSSSSSMLSAQKLITTTKEPPTSPTLTTTTTSTTTIRPTITKNNNINNPTIQKSLIESENLILTENLQKAFEGIPSLLRLQEINNARKKENSIEYGDEIAARMRLTDFLYAEYSLEEVIYQLAKVMFSQSLTHGSEQSQKALRRLTEFLENEGEHGRISPALQKKVLDVLLAALSDTLAEHPELLESARIGLGNSFHKLPKSSSLLNP